MKANHLNDSLMNLVLGLIALGIGTAGAIGTAFVIIEIFEGAARVALVAAVAVVYIAANITGIAIALTRISSGQRADEGQQEPAP